MQLEWHDGTVRNVHVDLPFLYEYQVGHGPVSQGGGEGSEAPSDVEIPSQ